MTLHLGDSGTFVGQLHQILIELGYPLSHVEMDAETFGNTTKAAVMSFQATRNLSVDGIVGNVTWEALRNPRRERDSFIQPGWRYTPSQIRPEVRRAVQAAVDDIGLKEEPPGSNDGPDLKKFNTGGLPWCAMSVSYWFSQLEGGAPFTRKESAFAIREWATAYKRLLGDAALPQPGDIAIIVRGDLHGHVGLVVDYAPTGLISTVEGNSANSVRGIVSSRSRWTCFARPVPLI